MGTHMFDKNEVNTGRQPELDICKGIVAFLLATIHVYVECSTSEQLFHGLPYFFDSIVGGPWAAPMFIFAMGIGLAYTRKSSPGELAKRGAGLILVGFGLNVCRYLLPSLVGYAITGDRQMYLDRLPYLFFGNDLLQFAALGMLFMALLKRFDLSPLKIWFVALAVNLVATCFRGVFFSNMALNIFLGHFIGVDDGTEIVMADFPLFIWFLFYASGYLAGQYLRRLKDKKKFYLMASPVCLVLVTVIYIIQYEMGFGMMGGEGNNVFYHMTTIEVFLCIATMIGMLGVYYFILPYLPKPVMGLMEFLSRNVTGIYCIQWTLVWWSCDVFVYIIRGDKYLPSWQQLILGLCLSFATAALAQVWSKFKADRKQKGK